MSVSGIGHGGMNQYAYNQALVPRSASVDDTNEAVQAGQAVYAAGVAAMGTRAVSGSENAKPSGQVGEVECKTCADRKYQDGSNDPGVSFKTPGHIDPANSHSAVRAHEQEHVSNERANAQSEDRKVVSQSVTLFTSICPECGRAYVSGGVTRTLTASDDNKAQASPYKTDGSQRGQIVDITV